MGTKPVNNSREGGNTHRKMRGTSPYGALRSTDVGSLGGQALETADAALRQGGRAQVLSVDDPLEGPDRSRG
jgi:hypothetical protein